MPSNNKRSTHSGPNSLECVRVKTMRYEKYERQKKKNRNTKDEKIDITRTATETETHKITQRIHEI